MNSPHFTFSIGCYSEAPEKLCVEPPSSSKSREFLELEEPRHACSASSPLGLLFHLCTQLNCRLSVMCHLHPLANGNRVGNVVFVSKCDLACAM